mgnify:CR=1 FL=1
MSPTSIRVSIVIPVYAGEQTLPTVLAEIRPLTEQQTTPGGLNFRVCEVILVHDCGPDRSDAVLEQIALTCPFARIVWLSRNYGQHAATMAGMASATGDWVVTIDEDGQQNTADIGRMLDVAHQASLQLVYARPTNPPPHGWLRNFASRSAKRIAARLLGSDGKVLFNSYRLIDGETARTLAAYCGHGVYLDVGLFWMVGRIGSCPVQLRSELEPRSSYSWLKLLHHFWTLILTSGTRPLRLITLMGVVSLFLAFGLSAYAIYGKYFTNDTVPGWTSLLIVISAFSGVILMSLGVIAEYLAITLGIAMGRPLYVVSSRPTRSGKPR